MSWEEERQAPDPLAAELGREALRRATGGDGSKHALQQPVAEDLGGPFVPTTEQREIAVDEDGIPEDAEVAARPQTMSERGRNQPERLTRSNRTALRTPRTSEW